MNTLTMIPETMTAEDRRAAWVHDELMNYGVDANRDTGVTFEYGHELMEILASRFRVIELILGQEEVAPHLLAMLHGPSDGGDTWPEFFANYDPTMTPHWVGTKLVDNAGMYGLYGVTPAEVPREARKGWVDALAQALDRFRELVQPDQGSVIARIVNLALSRHAMDCAEGEVDLQSLALFGGVTEGRIRNILSSTDSDLEKIGQRVTAASAAAWLKGRKEFFASIWQQPDEATPEAPTLDFSDEVLFVPVAADGSYFHPGLCRDGKFRIGAKETERTPATFEEALVALQKMATPRWRRPNAAGNWGIVSGRDWKRVERRQLTSL